MTITALPILKGPDFAARLEAIRLDAPLTAPWTEARHRRILVPSLIGGETMFAMTGAVVAALVRRGAAVTVLGCDATLPACAMRKVEHEDLACTRWCRVNAERFTSATNLDVRWLGDVVPPSEHGEIAALADRVTPDTIDALEDGGIPLGEHVLRAMESHLRVGRIDSREAAHRDLLPRFVEAAIIMRRATERVIADAGVQKVLTADGTKVLWGVPRDVALARGIGVDVLTGGPRGATLRIEPRRPGEPRRVLPDWPRWRDEPLTDHEEMQLDAYMDRRRTRPYAHLSLGTGTEPRDPMTVRRECGVRRNTFVMAMFPNLSWDSGVTSSSPLFGTAADWVIETIEHLAGASGITLLVKANPNERHRMSNDPLVDLLAQRFPRLPRHVRIIPPETTLTAQDLVRAADAALVYTSTVAAEAVYLETPLILVGGGAHAGQGVAHEMTSVEHYFATLDALVRDGRIAPAVSRSIARRYAYAVFFRSMLPARYHEALDGNVTRFDLTLTDLEPGGDEALDMACRAVMRDEPVDARAAWARD